LEGRLATTLIDVLVDRARHSPEATAFGVFEFADGEHGAANPRVYSYRELDARARAIAAALRNMVRPGERALLLYPPGAEVLFAFLGCLYAGVAAVPTSPPRRNRPDPRVQAIAADSKARVALTTAQITADRGAGFRRASELAALEFLATDTLAAADDPAPGRGTPDSVAFLQYTSGSTAAPKGVIVTHENLLHTLEDLDRGLAHDAESIMVSWLPTFHDLGLIYGVLLPLYVGFPSYLMAPAAFLQRPARWLEAISHLRATHTAAPNFAFDLCVNGIPPEQRTGLDLRSLRCVLNAAETVRWDTIRRFNEAFAGAGLHQDAVRSGYGLAEATLKVTTAPLGGPLNVLRVSAAALARHLVTPLAADSDEAASVIVGCGNSHAGARIEIVDPDRCIRADDGAVGEVWVAGKSVAQGYFARDEESDATFRARLLDDPPGVRFLRTGDLGFMHEGELFICGRCKDVIIIRGLNHYPQDIEVTTQQAHPALRANAGAAFAVEEAGEERLVIVQEVERTAMRHLHVEQIAAAVGAAVADAHELQVHALVLVRPGAVPKTSSGKIQRRRTKAEFENGGINEAIAVWRAPAACFGAAVSRAAGTPSEQEVEDWLLDFCAARLGVERSTLGSAEPLARYGMDSLAAADLARQLGSWLDRHVEPAVVFDYPSIGALARHFSAQDTAESVPRAGTRRDGRRAAQSIAIVGLGGRFPGAANPAAFWELLSAGKSALVSMPHDRPGADAFHARAREFGLPQIAQGGFLESVDLFDAAFFGISPREAESLDPQQRLLLEVSWEALEDAGLSPDELAGSNTGVFIGLSTNDYGRLLPAAPDEYGGTGNALSMAANRLSYFYDWQGPSVCLDTACSSSLVALHQACVSLREGECELALAGGVNLILSPHWSTSFARAGMLAPDGRCKTFDAAADGYVRGEGCGLVVLQRLEDAQSAGRPVLAIVRGSAINQDGRTNGLTAPNGQRQRDVISRALAAAGVAPGDVSYVEAHGTGTQLGDPIELAALREVLCARRPADRPLRVGSVKTNIGHLEAAAGVAGLIKLVLALQHRAIPPHLHFSQLNAKISGDATFPLIPRRLEHWESGSRPRIAAVSSFGFGGTNAHAVLEEAAPVPAHVDSGDGPLVLALSAKSPEALRQMARDYARAFDGRQAVRTLARAACVQRPQLEHRAAIVALSPASLRGALQSVAGASPAERETDASVVLGHAHRPPRVAFLFTGQGSLYPGVARELQQTHPVFREALERCAAILDRDLPVPLLALLHEEAHAAKLQQTLCAQPALFALAYALVALWKSWGVVPDAVLGHSVGEYAAACAAGAFDVETGLRIITQRARLMQALPAGGGMAAVFGSAAQVAETIDAFGEDLSIAALNGPRETVISGRSDLVAAACRRFEAAGTRAQPLAVSHAFHSTLMEPMLHGFTEFLGTQPLGAPRIPFVSNVTGSVEAQLVASPDYWSRHIRKPVQFGSGLAELHRLGCRAFVEIGPQPILIALARRVLTEPSLTHVASLRQGRADRRQMAEAAATLFASGVRISWRGVHQGTQAAHATLPSYPFQRQRYWLPQSQRQAASATARPDIEAFDVAWSMCDRPEQQGEREVRTWVVLCDETGVGDAIVAELRRHGADCIRIRRRAESARLASGDWLIASDDAEAFAALARELVTRSPAGVVHCWNLDAVEATSWSAAREAGCGSILQLFQALRRGRYSAAPRLWLVTRGSAPVGEGVARDGLAGAIAGGLARSLALEWPENWGGLHDLPQSPAPADIRNLVQELLQPSLDEAAWRGGRAWTPKLRRRAATKAPPLVMRQDGAYWVTGGWGALGLSVAQWLADRGAGLIVLSARREPNAAALAFAESCARRGVKVWLRRSDCADTAATLELARDIAGGALPLRGVFHVAGEGAPCPADDLGLDDLARVCRAKVEGAWNLHEATREMPLDHFVLFSSIAAAWGSRHQAHYGAANHFLDALACWRRRQGLPSLSISWGPWAGGGLIDSAGWRALQRIGLFAMAPEPALAEMEQLLAAGDVANAVVVHADWQRFPALFSALPRRRLFAEVATPATPAAPATVPPQRTEAIQPRLTKIVADLLGHQAGHSVNPQAGFADLGMDSVMSLDLRNCIEREFGIRLSATVAFDHPNLIRLTHHVTAALGSGASERPDDAPAPPPEPRPKTIERQIHDRLEELEGLLKWN
jgi:acyl transferase domain-containing protein/acyl-CoA synthetase (AMP-forming)/AMP-acid ligase II/acyl carrier protein